MRSGLITRILVITLCSAVGVVLLALAGVFDASEWMLRRSRDAPIEPLPTVSGAADLEEGKRLAIIVGCWAGCHGMQGEGDTMEAPGIFHVTGPTLSHVLPAYSDEELVRLIRYGVKRDGRSALGMASQTFYFPGDEDLSRIVAHLRRGPNMPPVPRERHVTIRGRTGQPLDGRDLGIMSWTARDAFTYFTDQEIADLYAYFRANPG